MKQRILIPLALLPCLVGAARAQTSPEPTHNSLAIDWHLPGTFEQTRQHAAREQRLLLIKGVSFGIDRVGATCATKGDW